MENQTRVVMLGSGTPNSEPHRSGPCVAIVVQGKSYVVDFGAGVVRRASYAYSENGVMALKPMNLKTAFLSHLHSDHTAGLPDLMLTPWILGREEPLTIYGPVGTQHMVSHIAAAYEVDINERINGHIKSEPAGGSVIVHEIEEGVIYEDDLVQVSAITVEHLETSVSYAFKFVTKDKVIVVSCDTNFSEKLIEFSRGCDILLHEVYYAKGIANLPEKWAKYHSSVHTSSVELGIVANEVKPKTLIVYHPVYLMGKNAGDVKGVRQRMDAKDLEMLNDIKLNYNGNIIIAQDDEIYE